MTRDENLSIYLAAFDLVVHVEEVVRGFSQPHKDPRGTELRQRSRAILERITAANSSPERERAPLLRELRGELETFKAVAQRCHESGGFPSNSAYLHMAEHVVGIARQNEGWLARADALPSLEAVKGEHLARELVEELALALGGAAGGGATDRASATADLSAAAEVQNPYKGLRAFESGDAADFFGREALVHRLLGRLAGVSPSEAETATPSLSSQAPASRFLAVVGPSGCGKSSVVKAGLLPALRRGAIRGSERWFVLEVVPGRHPLEELELGLLRVAVGEPKGLLEELRRDPLGLVRAARLALPTEEHDAAAELLLVVDQFEEVYTMAADRAATVACSRARPTRRPAVWPAPWRGAPRRTSPGSTPRRKRRRASSSCAWSRRSKAPTRCGGGCARPTSSPWGRRSSVPSPPSTTRGS